MRHLFHCHHPAPTDHLDPTWGTPHVFSEREAFLSLRRSLLPWGLCAPMKTPPRTGLGSSLGGRERHPHQLICRHDFHQPEVQSPPVIPAPLPATLSRGLVGDIHAPSPSKTALQLRSLLFVFSEVRVIAKNHKCIVAAAPPPGSTPVCCVPSAPRPVFILAPISPEPPPLPLLSSSPVRCPPLPAQPPGVVAWVTGSCVQAPHSEGGPRVPLRWSLWGLPAPHGAASAGCSPGGLPALGGPHEQAHDHMALARVLAAAGLLTSLGLLPLILVALLRFPIRTGTRVLAL